MAHRRTIADVAEAAGVSPARVDRVLNGREAVRKETERRVRETGFRSHVREWAPQFQVLDTLVNLETRQLTYEATLDLLARHPDLRGIYCAGGGMEGAIAALREARAPGEVCLVVNEVTPESRAALLDRVVTMVIATPLAQLCQDLVTLAADAARAGPSDVAGQHFLRPELVLPESV